MSVWMIERFGARQLEEAFLWITLIPLPAWILLIFWGRKRWMRFFRHPLVLPMLPMPVWFYVIYQTIELGMPSMSGTGYFQIRTFISHPLIFLVLWTQLQVINLFVATVILREGIRAKTNVTIELMLSWLLAPLALAVCAVRVGTKRTLFQ